MIFLNEDLFFNDVARIGTIAIKMYDGVTRILKEIRHVLDLKRNLISLGILDEFDYSFKVENDQLKFIKGALVVMKRSKRNRLYILNESIVVGFAYTTSKSKLDKTRI